MGREDWREGGGKLMYVYYRPRGVKHRSFNTIRGARG